MIHPPNKVSSHKTNPQLCTHIPNTSSLNSLLSTFLSYLAFLQHRLRLHCRCHDSYQQIIPRERISKWHSNEEDSHLLRFEINNRRQHHTLDLRCLQSTPFHSTKTMSVSSSTPALYVLHMFIYMLILHLTRTSSYIVSNYHAATLHH